MMILRNDLTCSFLIRKPFRLENLTRLQFKY